MGDLTNNLSRSEFDCECGCGFDTVDIKLVDVLQNLVWHFSVVYSAPVSIRITGPNRCPTHNVKIGGAADSQHQYGRAADFKLFNRNTGDQIDPDEVADYLEKEYRGKYGVGRYSNRVHFDTRTNGPARWDAR